MIYVFGSFKGGTGKSTDAVNFACWLSNKKKKVCIIDSDPISTAYKWSQYRDELKTVQAIPCYQHYGDLKQPITKLIEQYDSIVIDTPGKDSKEMRSACMMADNLIIPFKCSQPDLDTLSMLRPILNSILDFNRDLKIYALLSIAPTNPRMRLQNEAKDFLSDFPVLKPLKTIVNNRLPYIKCMSNGLGVIEFDKSHAKKEIDSLGRELTK